MFDAHETYQMLLESDKLPAMLKQAQAHATALAGPPRQTDEAHLAELNAQAEEVQKLAADVSRDLRAELAQEQARRDAKVACFRHMLDVAVRLAS